MLYLMIYFGLNLAITIIGTYDNYKKNGDFTLFEDDLAKSFIVYIMLMLLATPLTIIVGFMYLLFGNDK